jgi:hypothetical protein
MAMTRGPTDPGAVVEFTDWKRVDAFGHLLCRQRLAVDRDAEIPVAGEQVQGLRHDRNPTRLRD